MLEIEVKYYLGEEGAARNLVQRWGFVWTSGVYEVNRVFDFPDGRLASRGALVRIRTREDSASLTYKAETDVEVPKAKVRRELDSRVSNPVAVVELLTALGLEEVLRYERYRASYPKGDAQIEIDHFPGGWFCEIEGTPEAITEQVRTAGLEHAPAIAWSYPSIFRALCRRSAVTTHVWNFDVWKTTKLEIPAPGDPFWSDAMQSRPDSNQ